MKTTLENLTLVLTAKKIKGTNFVGILDYQNKQGEISNYLIIAGITYENVLKHDLKNLAENKHEILSKVTEIYGQTLAEKAFENVEQSLVKRLADETEKERLRAENDKTILRSDTQMNAYIQLAKGVKFNKENEEIHVFGLVQRKTILQAVEYKPTNSRDLTKAQNLIKKLANFKQEKYRTFIFDKAQIKMKGLTI